MAVLLQKMKVELLIILLALKKMSKVGISKITVGLHVVKMSIVLQIFIQNALSILNALGLIYFDVLASSRAPGVKRRNLISSTNLLTVVDKEVLVNPLW